MSVVRDKFISNVQISSQRDILPLIYRVLSCSETKMALVLMTITPSLKGFFIGLLAGGFVLAALAGAFVFLSQADRFR